MLRVLRITPTIIDINLVLKLRDLIVSEEDETGLLFNLKKFREDLPCDGLAVFIV